MFGIVVALKAEASGLLKIANIKEEFKLADKQAYLCNIDGHECILAISGIGKVSAALTAQILIDKYDVDVILNFGSCGGTNDSVKIANYYVVDKSCQYDFDLTELDPVPLGYIQDYDRVFFETHSDCIDFLEKATLASSDRFTNKNSDVQTVNSMGCSICDMEACAIAQVCCSNSIPLISIKGITDVYGSQTAPEQFMKNLASVSSGFPQIIVKAMHAYRKIKHS